MRRIALWVVLVTIGLWGVALYLAPGFIFETLGGADSVADGYSRYSGAWFLGVAVAAWLALQDGTGARPVLVISTIGASLAFITLLIDLLNDTVPTPNTWVIWLAVLDAAAIAILGGLALREEAATPALAVR